MRPELNILRHAAQRVNERKSVTHLVGQQAEVARKPRAHAHTGTVAPASYLGRQFSALDSSATPVCNRVTKHGLL